MNIVTQLTDQHEEEEEAGQTVVILSSDFRNPCEDASSDTSEVMIGSYLEPLSWHIDDSLIHEPFLEFEGDDLVITSITLATQDTSVNAKASSSAAPYDVVRVTIKFYRINILDVRQLRRGKQGFTNTVEVVGHC